MVTNPRSRFDLRQRFIAERLAPEQPAPRPTTETPLESPLQAGEVAPPVFSTPDPRELKNAEDALRIAREKYNSQREKLVDGKNIKEEKLNDQIQRAKRDGDTATVEQLKRERERLKQTPLEDQSPRLRDLRTNLETAEARVATLQGTTATDIRERDAAQPRPSTRVTKTQERRELQAEATRQSEEQGRPITTAQVRAAERADAATAQREAAVRQRERFLEQKKTTTLPRTPEGISRGAKGEQVIAVTGPARTTTRSFLTAIRESGNTTPVSQKVPGTLLGKFVSVRRAEFLDLGPERLTLRDASGRVIAKDIRRIPLTQRTNGSTGLSDSSSLGGSSVDSGALGQVQTQVRFSRFEERVKTSLARQERAIGPDNIGIQRIEAFGSRISAGIDFVNPFASPARKARASDLLFRNKLADPGSTSESIQRETIVGGLSFGVVVPQLALAAGEKIGATIDAATLPSQARIPGGTAGVNKGSILAELKTAGKETERGPFNFLPGGTPINREGATTLGTAAIFALPAAGGGGVKGPVRVETIRATTPSRAIKATVVGLDAGTKGTPLFTIVKTTAKTAQGKQVTRQVFRGRPTAEKGFEPVKLADLINPADRTITGGVDPPKSASAGKAFETILDLTPEQVTGVRARVEAAKILKEDPGLPVKDFVARVEAFNNPPKATKVIETFAARAFPTTKGRFFGSVTTEQLPAGFKSVKIGDVDLAFNVGSKRLAGKTESLAEKLRKAGEDVRVNPENPLEILSRSGDKVIELKSLQDPGAFGGEIAQTEFFGIKLRDISQRRNTVAFGKALATLQGQQFAAKASATLRARAASNEAAPGLQEAGVLGKPLRSAKDLAGFFQSGKGLIEIRKAQEQTSRAPQRTREQTARASERIDTFFRTLSKEEQAAVQKQLDEQTGGSLRLELEPSFIPSRRTSLLGQRELTEGFLPARGAQTSSSFRKLQETIENAIKTEKSLTTARTRSPTARTVTLPQSPAGKSSAPKSLVPFATTPVSPAKSEQRERRPTPSPVQARSPARSPIARSEFSASPSRSASPRSPVSPRSASPRSPSVARASFVFRPRLPRLPLPSLERRGEVVQGFRPFVKRFGKKEFLTQSPVSRERALFLGAREAGGTAVRTFGIEEAGDTEVFPNTQPSRFELNLALREFRQPRSRTGFTRRLDTGVDEDDTLFIERTQFAINTEGELQEITRKGLRAVRQKSRFDGLADLKGYPVTRRRRRR